MTKGKRKYIAAEKFVWNEGDVVNITHSKRSVSLSADFLEEFFNKCHASKDGEFCSTSGTAPMLSKTSAIAFRKQLIKDGYDVASVSKATSHSWQVTMADGQKIKVSGGGSLGKLPKASPAAPIKKVAVSKTVANKTEATSKQAVWIGTGKLDPKAEAARIQKIIARESIKDPFPEPGGMNVAPPPSGLRTTPLTDKETVALLLYRGSEYHTINQYLRTEKENPHQFFDHNPKDLVPDIDSAFNRAAPLEEPLTVFRGLKQSLKLGKEFVDKGFVSTSYKKGLAADFAADSDNGKLIEIHLPVGMKALKLSDEHKEGEILLPRGTTYRRIGQRVEPSIPDDVVIDIYEAVL